MNNLHVKTGDNVMIISGKDKGHTGKVPVSYTHLDVYKRQSVC